MDHQTTWLWGVVVAHFIFSTRDPDSNRRNISMSPSSHLATCLQMLLREEGWWLKTNSQWAADPDFIFVFGFAFPFGQGSFLSFERLAFAIQLVRPYHGVISAADWIMSSRNIARPMWKDIFVTWPLFTSLWHKWCDAFAIFLEIDKTLRIISHGNSEVHRKVEFEPFQTKYEAWLRGEW